MSPLQKAGLYYPNKFGLITIKSLEEVMGKNGLNAILNLAGLSHYIENYPPDNLDKGFDFANFPPSAPRWRKCTDLAAGAVLRCARDAQPFQML
jgi:hypothetical protein